MFKKGLLCWILLTIGCSYTWSQVCDPRPITGCADCLSDATMTVDVNGCVANICVDGLENPDTFHTVFHPNFIPHYRFFFTCQDGQYLWSDSVFAPGSGPPGNLELTQVGNCFQVCFDIPLWDLCDSPRMEIVLYKKTPPGDDDEDDIVKKELGYIWDVPFDVPCIAPPPPPVPVTSCNVFFTRQPRKGFYSNLLIEIQPLECPFTTGYTVKIELDDSFAPDPDSLPAYLPLVEPEWLVDVCIVPTPNGERHVMEIEVPPFTPQPTNLVANLYTPENTGNGTTQVKVFIEGCDLVIDSCMTDSLQIFEKNDPYDPNRKLVKIQGGEFKSNKTITNTPQTVLYKIMFVNEGKGATGRVVIKDTLDDRLIASSMRMVYVKLGNQSFNESDFNGTDAITSTSVLNPSIPGSPNFPFTYNYSFDPASREILWTFDGGRLIGGGKNYSDNSPPDPLTTGEIVFEIKTKCFEEYGITIKNEAYIDFYNDDPEPDSVGFVKSDPAIIYKTCCPLMVKDTGNAPVITRFSLLDFRTQNTLGPPDPTWTINLVDSTFTHPLIIKDHGGVWGTSGTVSYRIDTPLFVIGIDTLVFEVCDNSLSPVACETIVVAICVNKIGHYPCNQADCPPPSLIDKIVDIFSEYPVLAWAFFILLAVGAIVGGYRLVRRFLS